VASFRFSRRAEADLTSIVAFTLRAWGEAQAAEYLDQLESRFQALADNPRLGRACAYIRPGLRRFEHGRHVVFYRLTAQGILISRILHERMLPDRHNFVDEPNDP
jgi:toxin ParE1/3/4